MCEDTHHPYPGPKDVSKSCSLTVPATFSWLPRRTNQSTPYLATGAYSPFEHISQWNSLQTANQVFTAIIHMLTGTRRRPHNHLGWELYSRIHHSAYCRWPGSEGLVICITHEADSRVYLYLKPRSRLAGIQSRDVTSSGAFSGMSLAPPLWTTPLPAVENPTVPVHQSACLTTARDEASTLESQARWKIRSTYSCFPALM